MEPTTPEIFSNDCFYLSAPTSPRRLSMDSLCFYSVPTSPARKSFKAKHDAETEPTTPTTYEDANTGFIEFEFETSRRFDYDGFEKSQIFESTYLQQKQQYQECCQEKESFPAMAFADELFCDGKVMPLKPPPRLQYGNSNENNSALSSPRSPTGVLKFPFQRRSLWNDDFDPFMVALENVKQEQREKTHRRARSMSPLRSRSPKSGPNSDGQGKMEVNVSGPCSIWAPNQKGNFGFQDQKRPIRLAEPKGVLFARSARLVKMDHEKPKKLNMGKGSGATETGERGEGSRESEGSNTRGSKRQKIKTFLLKSASMRKTKNEEKQKEESVTLPKRSYTRKFSFKSMRSGQYNEDKRISEVNKMTLMQYRPKLFLCMGYGTRVRLK